MGARQHGRTSTDRHGAVLEIVAEAATEVVELSPGEVLDRVVAVMARLGFWRGGMWMVEGDVFVLRASIEETNRLDEDVLSAGLCGEVLGTGDTVIIDDYRTYPSATPSGRAIGLRGVVATPIKTGGTIVGVLAGSLDRPWTDEAAALVRGTELLAGMAGRALEVAARYEAEQQTVAELRRIDELKDDFLSTASHELRTPLTVLLGTTEMLLTRWDAIDDDLRRRLLQRAVHNGHALNGVIETLLDFRRLDRGSWTYQPDTVRVDRVVARVAARIGSLLEQHDVKLDLEPALGSGDPRLLERVIENLLMNAARHTPAGTAVRVAVINRPEGVEVEVADQGPGIAPEDLERIGQRFFRGGSPTTRDSRGMGLGLALVREVLEMHGSTLRIASRHGAGSTFAFTLPHGEPPHDDSDTTRADAATHDPSTTVDDAAHPQTATRTRLTADSAG